MKPPMPNPPQNGQRLPPKPTKRDVEDLAVTALERARRAEQREVVLARMIVLVLAGPWYARLWFAARIVLRLRLYMPRVLLDRVSATQLYADVKGDGYVLGADARKVQT